MATDIEEVYKMFPCAKAQAEENIAFWDSDEALNESNMPKDLDACFKIKTGEESLHKFFEQIVHHDHFLWKEGHITEWEEKKRNRIIEQLTEKHLGYFHDALYNSPKLDDEFLDDETYWRIFFSSNPCEDQF